ncbi:MAG: hypothetical protein ACRC1K_17330 [Planctomycetia bacterium]
MVLERCWKWATAATLLGGCAIPPGEVIQNRPAVYPPPNDVQAEIRDARYFLAFPDEALGPETGFMPKDSERSASSR